MNRTRSQFRPRVVVVTDVAAVHHLLAQATAKLQIDLFPFEASNVAATLEFVAWVEPAVIFLGMATQERNLELLRELRATDDAISLSIALLVPAPLVAQSRNGLSASDALFSNTTEPAVLAEYTRQRIRASIAQAAR